VFVGVEELRQGLVRTTLILTVPAEAEREGEDVEPEYYERQRPCEAAIHLDR
jgi:hypothetical protein